MQPKALISADWHIRRSDNIWLSRPDIRGDMTFALAQVRDIVRKFDVRTILLAGDILHEPIQRSYSISLLRELGDEFTKESRRVVYVQGQHELADPPWLSSIHPVYEHVHGKVFQLDGIPATFYGLDYIFNADDFVSTVKSIPASADVLLTHQTWRELMGTARGKHSISALPSNVRIVLSGDLHDSFLLDKSPFVLSPGPIFAQNISEFKDTRYVYLMDEQCRIAPIALRSRRYYLINLIGHKEYKDELVNAIRRIDNDEFDDLPENLRVPIVHIYCLPHMLQSINVLLQHVGNKYHVFTNILRKEDIELSAVARNDFVSFERAIDLFAKDQKNANLAKALFRAPDSDKRKSIISSIFDALANGASYEIASA